MWTPPPALRASSFALNPQRIRLSCHHWTIQVRHFAGQKDRALTSLKTCTPTPKQRKRYHKHMREIEYEKKKHSRPNLRASIQ
jgi:hypothetical protein